MDRDARKVDSSDDMKGPSRIRIGVGQRLLVESGGTNLIPFRNGCLAPSLLEIREIDFGQGGSDLDFIWLSVHRAKERLEIVVFQLHSLFVRRDGTISTENNPVKASGVLQLGGDQRVEIRACR